MVRNPKQNILVSFSGGETSAYMINWLLLNKPDHNYKFVFANTGEENEETLLFAHQCAEFFGIDLVWLEYETLSFKVVDFKTAYRSHDPKEIVGKWRNHPFRKFIAKSGIPNMTAPMCSNEIKGRIIKRYMRSIGWLPSKYDLAIGIRSDEIDRIGKYYYPLVSADITKLMINAFWSKMAFRLQLKGYQGNCKTCWKKSFRKLATLATEKPETFAFFRQMEKEYGEYLPEGRKQNDNIRLPIRFFRNDKTVDDIFEIPKQQGFEKATDDSINTKYQTSILHNGTELDITNGCVESCEVFT